MTTVKHQLGILDNETGKIVECLEGWMVESLREWWPDVTIVERTVTTTDWSPINEA